MEQRNQIRDPSTDTFPSGPSMEYSTECFEVPSRNQAHTIQYEPWPSTFDGYGMNMAYLGGMDVTRNIIDENFMYDNFYFMPYEEYVSSDSDDGDYRPPENLNYDYLNNSCQNEWHQEDFYNGANLEYLYSPQYSISMPNCTPYFRRGTMYFIPFQNTSNSFYTGQVTYTQSQPALTNTVIQLPDVVQVEDMSESTCTENPTFAVANVENCQETMEAETPSTESTNAGSPQTGENTEIPDINYANEIETSHRKHSPTKAKTQSTDSTNAEIPDIDDANNIGAMPGTSEVKIQSTEATNAKPSLKATHAEIQNIDNANKIETMPGTTQSKIQSTEGTNAKSPLKGKSTEIPNIDYKNTIETLPGTTKVETISERDVSELANTLSDYTISGSSNSEFQLNASNSNCQEPTANCFGKDTNYESSPNSTKLSNGERNYERIDDKDLNVSDRVENGGYRGQRGRNRRNRGNSRRSDSNIISFKNFNSKRSYPTTTITFIPNDSLKHLNDRNSNNGLENAFSRQESTRGRQGNRRNNENSDVTISRDDLTSNACNGACSVHCDKIPYRKNPENHETSGASSEVSENNISYSAVVKRSLNSVH